MQTIHMRQLARTAIVALLTLGMTMTAGCGKSQQQAAPAAPRLPSGIVTTGHPPAGIYPAYGDELCCWLADDVRFDVPARAGQSVVLSVFQPKAGPLAKKDQNIRMIASDGKVIAAHPVHSGASVTVRFPLTAGVVHGGVASVHLMMSGSFVPKALGTSPDIRRLSLILAGVRVQ